MKVRRVNVRDKYIGCPHCPDNTDHDLQLEIVEDDDNEGFYMLVPWLKYEQLQQELERLVVERDFAEHCEKETHSLNEVAYLLQIEDMKDEMKKERLDNIMKKDELEIEIKQLEMTNDGLVQWITNLTRELYEKADTVELVYRLMNQPSELMSEVVYMAVNRGLYEELEAHRKGEPCAPLPVMCKTTSCTYYLDDDETDETDNAINEIDY